MAPDTLYLVRIDKCSIQCLGAVLVVCNAIVREDRDRKHHEMVITPDLIYPLERLPRKVRHNLSCEQADQLVAELAQAGAAATKVEQRI